MAYHGRKPEEAERVAKEANEKYGVETVGVAADGTHKGAMEKLVEEVEHNFLLTDIRSLPN